MVGSGRESARQPAGMVVWGALESALEGFLALLGGIGRAGRKRRAQDRDEASAPRKRRRGGHDVVVLDEETQEAVSSSFTLPHLPDEIWGKIMGSLRPHHLASFACTCRQFRRVQAESSRALVASAHDVGFDTSLTEKWFLWHGERVNAESGSFGIRQALINGAASRGYLAPLQRWKQRTKSRRERRQLWTCETATRAAEGGHVLVLRWLRLQGCPMNEWTCAYAAKGGHLETLKWLRDRGCPWNDRVCEGSASKNHLDVLKWARSQRPPCPWDARTTAAAAESGHMELLRWAVENGAESDELTLSAAAEGGHLEAIKYLRSRGTPWDESVCASAALSGHLEVLKWLRQQGCPWGERRTQTTRARSSLLSF